MVFQIPVYEKAYSLLAVMCLKVGLHYVTRLQAEPIAKGQGLTMLLATLLHALRLACFYYETQLLRRDINWSGLQWRHYYITKET